MNPLERAVKKSYTGGIWTPDAKAIKADRFSYMFEDIDPHPAQHVYNKIFESTGMSVFYESFTRNSRRGPFVIGRVSLRVDGGIQPFLYMATLDCEKLLTKREGPGGELEELFDHVAEETLAGKREKMRFLDVEVARLHVN